MSEQKGYWLSRSECIYALDTTPSKWNIMQKQFERKLNEKGTKKLFWVPEQKVTPQFKQQRIAQQKDTEQILQQLEDNVDLDADDLQLQSINLQLKKAKKDQILVKTKYLVQRLQQRKKQLFTEWSYKFFECFSNHFGRFKNFIVELHLNEEQIKMFNQILQDSLKNLQLNLTEIYNQFSKQNGDSENEN